MFKRVAVYKSCCSDAAPSASYCVDCAKCFLRRQSAVVTTRMSLALSDYDYPLPEELIATRPLPKRQDSRMMVVHRREQQIEHRKFTELSAFLQTGDLLVLNNTRVV